MGRKLRGASLRAKKRGEETAKEMVETKAHGVETQMITEQTDEQLFVLDTTAVPVASESLRSAKKRKIHTNSSKEKQQIQKLIETHAPAALQQLAAQVAKTSKRAQRKGVVEPKLDLWQNENKDDTKKMARKPGLATTLSANVSGIKLSSHSIVKPAAALKRAAPAVALDVARAGQSYNPDQKQHDKVIRDAVDIEVRRQKAEDYKATPISAGMSAETRAFILGDSSDEESDIEDNGSDSEQPLEKKREKLTKAQRNKQKRVRAEKSELEQRKRQKKLQASVGEAKTITKKIRVEEVATIERKQKVDQLKIDSTRVKGTDIFAQLTQENPIGAPTFPVALPSELLKAKSGGGGGLRTLKPKGSLVTDRISSLMDRDMAPKKQLKQRKRTEGKRRKQKVRGKGFEATKEGQILG
jgi:nucleolar protein 53